MIVNIIQVYINVEVIKDYGQNVGLVVEENGKAKDAKEVRIKDPKNSFTC
jgi:hypothetical protein